MSGWYKEKEKMYSLPEGRYVAYNLYHLSLSISLSLAVRPSLGNIFLQLQNIEMEFKVSLCPFVSLVRSSIGS